MLLHKISTALSRTWSIYLSIWIHIECFRVLSSEAPVLHSVDGEDCRDLGYNGSQQGFCGWVCRDGFLGSCPASRSKSKMGVVS